MPSSLAGSAARMAENESRTDASVPSMTVQAGSAARDAEESKRAGLSNTPLRGAVISLRAQAGVVQRSTAAPTARQQHIESADKEAVYPVNDAPSKSDMPASLGNSPISADLHTTHDPSASTMQQMAIGVQTILQRMFSVFGKDS